MGGSTLSSPFLHFPQQFWRDNCLGSGHTGHQEKEKTSMRNWWIRFTVLAAATIISIATVIPTLMGLDPETSKFPLKSKVTLGLDLQGGLYLVLGVDFNQVFRDILERQGAGLLEGLREKTIPVTSSRLVTEGFPQDDARFELVVDPKSRDAAYALVKDNFKTLRVTEDNAGKFQLGIAHETRTDIKEKTVGQSIEVIRNRIDEFGVSEPVIASQGSDRVVVELPGVKDINRAKELIGRTARLEFRHVMDKAMDPNRVAALIAELEKDPAIAYKKGEKFSAYTERLNRAAAGKLPPDSMIAFERISAVEAQQRAPGDTQAEMESEDAMRIPYLLSTKVEVSGQDLDDAQVGMDQETRAPNVSFQFNPRGASLFEAFTGSHIGERLGIVLDGIVHSAPVINGRIGSRGVISVGRGSGDALREAKDLSIVLRAGALPAQLNFLEERVVGPSLGQDSVRSAAMASVLGVILVFICTALYYRMAGLIAVVSLLLNVLFVLAVLVWLEATLTLPGIAGIALTVGIAVDSNVVIYERIREEIRAGKGVFTAVEFGFQKAFRTILDANVTNAIASLILLNFGTGPIKGFAVTLLIGIITTMFTAIFVCRVMFDSWLSRLEHQKNPTLSI